MKTFQVIRSGIIFELQSRHPCQCNEPEENKEPVKNKLSHEILNEMNRHIEALLSTHIIYSERAIEDAKKIRDEYINEIKK